jgi:hypothetical protein
MPKRLRVVPSARRLIQSLRDLGYDLPSAVADLVDNSIAAKATRVWVDIDVREHWIRITDNGRGMSGRRITEAMRYGSEADYDDEDLGKYGLGLKTASTSQCQRVTVASRRGSGGRVQIRRWDLEEVMRRDQWDVESLRTDESNPALLERLAGRGTVVMWEELDRILRYEREGAADNWLLRACRDVERHLAMVFHRFLAGESRRRLPLTILLNDNPVDAWDPYCRAEKHTRELPMRRLKVDREGATHTVRVEPYVLPNRAQFSNTAAFDAAAGPRKWNRQQGFYIYRGDRMIQSGGWNRLRVPDEHTKLARVAVLFDRDADECFDLNVSKMRVLLPDELRQDFERIATEVTKRAALAYKPTGGSSTAFGVRQRAASSGRGGKPNDEGPRDANLKILKRIIAVLQDELRGQPRLLTRLLLSLADIDPIFAAANQTSRRAG